MSKKDYKLAYDYIYNLLSLDEDSMRWPLTIDSMDIFKELVNEKINNPTLEEVKKEWEKLGYEWRIPKEYPHMIWLVSDDDEPKWVLHIKINTQSKKYWKRWGDLSVEPFTFQEHQLLTKMFRALGWY